MKVTLELGRREVEALIALHRQEKETARRIFLSTEFPEEKESMSIVMARHDSRLNELMSVLKSWT